MEVVSSCYTINSINGTQFTPREIDVISCVISGRSIKSTSNLLGISAKTADFHVRNIMTKFGCNSKDSIARFVEQSEEYSHLTEHYKVLINKVEHETKIQFNDINDNSASNWKFSLKYIIVALFAGTVVIFCLVKVFFCNRGCIMSNLYYVSSYIVLRPSLLQKINSSIKNNKNDIKVVIITGRGGAGKTTIAKSFMKDGSFKIKWDINAESKQTVIDSFYDIATVIADKQGNKQKLFDIKAISNPAERTKQIMLFVCLYLKSKANWCLLFDNVDDIGIIKEYFPLVSDVWGSGVVLITTRNENIRKCNLFPSSVIPVGQLEQDEQYQLFCDILYDGRNKVPHDQIANIKELLSKIPMFPLDVSSAAYYIKNTKIKFEDYLYCVHSLNTTFENVHEKVVSEYMAYDRTRNGIITSILNKIIKEKSEFIDLLLFICMIDSQNIPVKLLEEYKGKSITHEFLDELRRFSIINERDNTFSIHRSTQKIGRNYIWSQLPETKQTKLLDEIVKVMTPYERMLANRYEKQDHYLTAAEQKSIAQHATFFIKNMEKINVQKKKEYKARLMLSVLYAHRTNDNFSEALIPIAGEVLSINQDGLYVNGYDFAVLQLEYIYYKFSISDYSKGEERLNKIIDLCDTINAKSLKVIAITYLAQFYCEYNEDFEKCKQYLEKAKNLLDECDGQVSIVASVVLSNRYQICYLSHYVCGKELESTIPFFEYALNKLKAQTFFYKEPNKYNGLSKIQYFLIPNTKKRLAKIYNHLEMYETAREYEKEAEFFYKREETFSALETLLKIDEGYTLLRMNKISEAREVISKTIQIKQRIGAFQGAIEAFVWLSEANIRLGKFIEAYDNCANALRFAKKSKTNFTKLLKIICYYNMAIAKYKLSDNEKSIEHFRVFFELAGEFCRGFLNKDKYEKLLERNVFEMKKDISEIKECIRNSIKIFSAIYGENHSFIRNYINKID